MVQNRQRRQRLHLTIRVGGLFQKRSWLDKQTNKYRIYKIYDELARRQLAFRVGGENELRRVGLI